MGPVVEIYTRLTARCATPASCWTRHALCPCRFACTGCTTSCIGFSCQTGQVSVACSVSGLGRTTKESEPQHRTISPKPEVSSLNPQDIPFAKSVNFIFSLHGITKYSSSPPLEKYPGFPPPELQGVLMALGPGPTNLKKVTYRHVCQTSMAHPRLSLGPDMAGMMARILILDPLELRVLADCSCVFRNMSVEWLRTFPLERLLTMMHCGCASQSRASRVDTAGTNELRPSPGERLETGSHWVRHALRRWKLQHKGQRCNSSLIQCEPV